MEAFSFDVVEWDGEALCTFMSIADTDFQWHARQWVDKHQVTRRTTYMEVEELRAKQKYNKPPCVTTRSNTIKF